MSPEFKRILEEAKKLPEKEREQLMDALNALPPDPLDPIDEAKRRAAVERAHGRFAHLPGSVDEFLARKQEDIDLEDRKFRR